jgi:hypothetical protein
MANDFESFCRTQYTNERIGWKDLVPGTLNHYKILLKHIRSFIRQQYGKDDVELKDFN